MPIPTISVILLTCNRLGLTKKTLRYLLESTHVDYELVIVHNHNKTKGAEKVADYFRNLKLEGTSGGKLKKVVKIFNKKNRGVAGGRNDGIYKSIGRHKVYIDDDILAPDCWAEEMLRVVDNVPEVATIGISVEKHNFKPIRKNGIVFEKKDGNIGGAFAMIPRRTFNKLGYLCEDYGLYGMEDADLHLRVHAIGKWNAYVYKMKAQHIDPESDKVYRKYKNNVYAKGSKIMQIFAKNKKQYEQKKNLYIPYKPKI